MARLETLSTPILCSALYRVLLRFCPADGHSALRPSESACTVWGIISATEAATNAKVAKTADVIIGFRNMKFAPVVIRK
jgi:hypothetical protein